MVTFPYEKRMSSYSSKVICGMFSQWFDDNGYRKQKSCNHLITTLLLSKPITIKPLTKHWGN